MELQLKAEVACGKTKWPPIDLTLDVLQHHAQVPARLKGTKHGNNEGVLRKGENVPLHKGLLDLVPQDQILLVDLLHGKALPGLPVAHKIHGPGQTVRLTTDN